MDAFLEEVAEVRDYVLWVVIAAGAIAWLVVVRTFPQATVGTVGAVVGTAVGVPVGLAWFPTVWLAAIAVSAVVGAVIGATIGAWIGRRRRRAGREPTLASSVVAVATACGMVGAYGTGYIIAFMRERPPDFDLASCFAGLLGGAAGWTLGAWMGASFRHRATADGGEVAALMVLVFAAVTMGSQVALGIRAASFGPMIDDVGRRNPSLRPLEITAWIGTALVTATFATLAFRAASTRASTPRTPSAEASTSVP